VGPGESGETTGIWAISILGAPPRKLREDAGRAAVSVDGGHIAFIATRSESEIWVMGANGEQPRRLLQGASGDRFLQVQWSPDGQRIAYMKSHTEGDKPTIHVETVPVAGGLSTTLLSDPGVRSFCWTADGRLIYSLQEAPPNDNDTNLWELRVQASGEPQGNPARITSWAGLSLLELSATADGKRLVFVNSGFQTDVYVGELQSAGRLETPRRLTLAERNDVPSAWMPDGQTLLFHSDRNGNWDLFKQRLHERNAADFIVAQGDQSEARLSPDRSWILYWEHPASASGPMHLQRIPISGGAPETVLEAGRPVDFRCAARHKRCLLSEVDRKNNELVLTTFDPVRGRMGEMLRLAADSGTSPAWDLSPDGATIAVVDLDERKHQVRLIDLETGSGRIIAANRSMRVSGVSWSGNGDALFLTGSSVRGTALLRASLSGAVAELWTTTAMLARPLASPDGKHLAFASASHNSNAWMIENF
jgi:Tol biopolymer transport system component